MLGAILAATCVVTMMRVLPLKTIFGLATPIDLGFSALLIWMFHGTLAGMAGAATGGLLLAVWLSAGKWLIGSRSPRLVRSGRFSWKAETVSTSGAAERGWRWLKACATAQLEAAKMRMAT